MSTEQIDLSGVSADDAEILNHQLNGVESEKEAADVRVSRMLKEEADAGRGKEQFELDDEDEGEQVAKTADEPTDEDKAAKAKAEETDSQRRRRLRREASDRTRSESAKAQQEIGRLKERLKQVETKNPDPEAYGDDTATYIADRAGYAAQHVNTTDQLEQVEARAKSTQAEMQRLEQQAMQDYFADGNRRFPDFERTLKADHLPFTPAMTEALMDDGMHDIAYELAKQPEEVARIAALPSPILQVKEILRVQAALQAKAADRVTTKAPPPIKPIRAAGAPATKSPSDMTMAEYSEYRKNQLSSSRR
jgi:hypothetical protein